MSILEIPCKNTFVHYPLLSRSTLLARHKRGISCGMSFRIANPEPQAMKFDGSRLPRLHDFTAPEDNWQVGARLCGSARWRSARRRSGRSGWRKPVACETDDTSDAETAVPSPDASPCPSSAGSPLQTPSPSPILRVPMNLLELPLPECDGLQSGALSDGKSGVLLACRDVPQSIAQHASGNIIADREGSYAALLDPSSCDLVLETPSPVLPTWRPAWAHKLSLRNVAAVEADVESDDDTCSNFSDDSDFFGCSCQCGCGRRAHVPFASFLGSDEIDEDFCPSCCSQNSPSHAPLRCSSPELEFRSPCTVYDSPGEAFWR